MSLLYPNSIAVTGVTANSGCLGSCILRNIINSEYTGRIFPINRKLGRIQNLAVNAGVGDVKVELDLAILASSSDRVIDDIAACIKAQVKSICIASGGFAETGRNGLLLQKKIVQMTNEAGMRVLGPNSLGIISVSKSLNATFGLGMPVAGKAVFLSQSGALINALLEYARVYSLGFSEIIGLGNKSDLNEIDFLKYYMSLRADGRPSVLGCYLENIADGYEFVEIAHRFSRNTPLIMLIPSETPKTSEYIYFHSGSIVQQDKSLDLALAKAGVIKVYTQEQLYDLLLGFSWQVLPRGNKVAVVSNAGGGLILAIEQIYRKGLELVNFSTQIKKTLTSELDWKMCGRGVIDLGGEALSQSYLKALDIVLGDSDVNAVIVILSPQIMTEIEQTAEVIGRLARDHGKTIIAAFMGYDKVQKGIKALASHYIPAFNSVDRAVFVLSKMYEHFLVSERTGPILTRFSHKESLEEAKSMEVLGIIETARVEKRVFLELAECLQLLKSYGIDTSSIRKLKKAGEIDKYPVEYYCGETGKWQIICSPAEAEVIFHKHSQTSRVLENHRLQPSCCFVRRASTKTRKHFKLSIKKDTYYEHQDKGWTIKDLKRLSLGYYLEIQNIYTGKKSSCLLPLEREQLEDSVLALGLIDKVGFQTNLVLERLKINLVDFIGKICQIPQNFSQILEMEVVCKLDKRKISLLACSIKLDLIGD